jgi:hypothetical protein
MITTAVSDIHQLIYAQNNVTQNLDNCKGDYPSNSDLYFSVFLLDMWRLVSRTTVLSFQDRMCLCSVNFVAYTDLSITKQNVF